MAGIIELQNQLEFESMLERSSEVPCFLFKHSTRCGISSSAMGSFQKFVDSRPEAEFYQVLVIQNRQLSNHIARHTGISHESPQVLLFCDGMVVWDESHWSIGPKKLEEALITHK